jgi:hypothetical protein
VVGRRHVPLTVRYLLAGLPDALVEPFGGHRPVDPLEMRRTAAVPSPPSTPSASRESGWGPTQPGSARSCAAPNQPWSGAAAGQTNRWWPWLRRRTRCCAPVGQRPDRRRAGRHR